MGNIIGLAHIGVYVKDLAASKDFYVNKLGFSIDQENDLGGVTLCFISKGTCLIELVYHAGPADTKVSRGAVIDHIAMEVKNIEEVVEDLKAKGIEFEGDISYGPAIHGGVKNIFFRGPDDEHIEFFDYL